MYRSDKKHKTHPTKRPSSRSTAPDDEDKDKEDKESHSNQFGKDWAVPSTVFDLEMITLFEQN
jgi:hypothetical protein